MAMNHASLFSGIGGFDLASQWMGWNNIFTCEIEPFPRTILKHHFPNATHYEDIKRTDFTVHRGSIDILTGGFPCQPFSTAGKRLGKEDERHLWPQMYRAIREIKPTFIVGENVRGLLSWSDGLVLDEVYADLENEGYEVQSFVLPAASVNAPHKRDRVWIVAKNTLCSGLIQRKPVEEGAEVRQQRDVGAGGGDRIHREERIDASNASIIGLQETRSEQQTAGTSRGGIQWDASNATHNGRGRRDCQRCQERRDRVVQGESEGSQVGSEAQGRSGEQYATHAHRQVLEHRDGQGETCGSAYTQERTESLGRPRGWEAFPTQPPVCGGDDGIPTQLDSISFPKWRKESIKAYGNAIVPQIAYRIFQAIEESIQ